ncbi:MAG: beta-ketoacyl-ACP synthase III [Chloroflexota bacterium]
MNNISPIKAKIKGWGHYIPEKVVTNLDLEKVLDTSDAWITKRTGIKERRFANSSESTASMAIEAGKAALNKACLSGDDVDFIIVATNTPDELTPPVSSVVQAALTNKHIPATTMMAGCSGFMYGLDMAYQFIGTNRYKRVLVIGSDFMSRFFDWEDRTTAVLFGDGAGAILLEATENECGLYDSVFGSDGSQSDAIVLGGLVDSSHPSRKGKRTNVMDINPPVNPFIFVDGSRVFKFATNMLASLFTELLTTVQVTEQEGVWCIPHQANLRIIKAAARTLNTPVERFITNIDRVANTSSASIPIALAENLDSGKFKPSDFICVWCWVNLGRVFNSSRAFIFLGKDHVYEYDTSLHATSYAEIGS